MLLRSQRVSSGLNGAPLFESGSIVRSMLVEERRRSQRQSVVKNARLLADEGASQGIYDCLVLDESAEGALVDMGSVYSLPESVALQILGGEIRHAIMRWHAGTKIGLEYCAAPLGFAQAG